MSIETGLYAYLTANSGVSAIVSTRLYPLKLPQGATLPALAYQLISNARPHDITAGPTGHAFPRFQITSYAESYSAAKSLAAAVRSALDGYRGAMGSETGVGGVALIGERDSFETETEYPSVQQDYLIPHSE